jgi:hypothetical protein
VSGSSLKLLKQSLLDSDGLRRYTSPYRESQTMLKVGKSTESGIARSTVSRMLRGACTHECVQYLGNGAWNWTYWGDKRRPKEAETTSKTTCPLRYE